MLPKRSDGSRSADDEERTYKAAKTPHMTATKRLCRPMKNHNRFDRGKNAHPCDVPSLVGDGEIGMLVLPRETNHLWTANLATEKMVVLDTHQARCHEEDDVRDRVYRPVQTPEEEKRRGDPDDDG